MLEVVTAMQDWIDAVPQDTLLPAMPGFDRDWACEIISNSQAALQRDDDNPSMCF